MEEEEKKEANITNFKQELMEQVENKIQEILNVNIEQGNVDYLGKLVDIHKDIKNEEYWKEKEGIYKMRYYDENMYGNYGRKMRDSRSYGRRGVLRNWKRKIQWRRYARSNGGSILQLYGRWKLWNTR